MLNYFRFASVKSPEKYGYVVCKETTFDRCHGVCRWAKFYDTYGDGAVQHSAEVPFQIEMLEDFLGSLATALAAADDAQRADMMAIVDHNWPIQQNSKDKITFALSLKAKEKTFYYNVDDCKSSTSESKKWDKRWTAVHSYDSHVNGEVSSAAAVLQVGHCYDTICAIAAWLEIVAVASDWTTMNVWTHFRMAEDFRTTNMVESAWNAVSRYVDSYRLAKHAKRSAECWAHNVANAREKAQTAVA